MSDVRNRISDAGEDRSVVWNLSSGICRLASVGSVIFACLRRSEAPASRRQVVHNQPMPKPTAIGAILIIGPGAAVTGDAGRMVVG